MSASPALAARPRRTAFVVGILALLALAALLLWLRPGPASANPLTGVAAVAAGNAHTCALTTAGGVKCWGRNLRGQLGDGTTIDSATPVDVLGLTSGVTAIAAGGRHTCALTAADGVRCWGDNWAGQLGDSTTTASAIPVDVSGLTSGVAAVAVGADHTCAVTTAGGLKCWGRNTFGELGIGPPVYPYYRVTPVDVCETGPTPPCTPGNANIISGVAAVAGGTVHTCAVTTAGGVKCWGWNGWGQIGADTTELCPGFVGEGAACSTAPVDVVGLDSGVAAVASGYAHTCALSTAGGVKCWGRNTRGQLGDGTRTTTNVPVDVMALASGVAAVAAAQQHSCALTTAAGVKCWGENSSGQLGDGTTADSSTPVGVVGLTNGVAAVAAGEGHTCAVTTASRIKCWGRNNSGQLGDGTFIQSTTPVDVVGLGPKPTPPPPVGGISVDPDLDALPLETPDTSLPNMHMLAPIAALTAGVLALGGVALYARRRRLR